MKRNTLARLEAMEARRSPLRPLVLRDDDRAPVERERLAAAAHAEGRTVIRVVHVEGAAHG